MSEEGDLMIKYAIKNQQFEIYNLKSIDLLTVIAKGL